MSWEPRNTLSWVFFFKTDLLHCISIITRYHTAQINCIKNCVYCIYSTNLNLTSTMWIPHALHSMCIFILCAFHCVGCICLIFSTVCFQMCPQIACIRGCIVTLVAFVCLFSAVDFQMCPQCACIRGCIVTLVTLV